MDASEEKKASKKTTAPAEPGLLDVMIAEMRRRFKPSKKDRELEDKLAWEE